MDASVYSYWESEYIVNESLARILIDQCCPDLYRTPHEFLGSGWDFEVWRCGDLAFRFPRRPIAIDIGQKEEILLPKLAQIINITIPMPRFSGKSHPLFLFPYWVYNYISGYTANTFSLTSQCYEEIAIQIGIFLRELHGISFNNAMAIGLELDIQRGDLHHNRKRAKESAAIIKENVNKEWNRVLDSFLDKSPPPSTHINCVVHGDFHSDHLILNEQRRLSAVIDWGGACISDPALDLSIVYTFLPIEHHSKFWNTYGEVDLSTKSRARYLGVCRYGIRALAYAMISNNPKLARNAWSVMDNNLSKDL
jgi:aminoglycoside phosphotransferase (APT) family kinase protein